MPRVVSVFLPFLATDLARRHRLPAGEASRTPDRLPGPKGIAALRGGSSRERPLATVVRDGSRRLLAAVDETALALGLRPGQAAAQAQATIPGLVLVDAALEAERAALLRLAGWCTRYSPVVQPDPPDGILFDTQGAAQLFGGEAALLRDVVRRLGRAGLSARASLADTPGAAAAMARHHPGLVVAPGGSAAALAGLPVGALRCPGETCRGLALLGIARIGDLLAFPRAQLALRFGPQLMARYDRAVGRAPDPLTALIPATVAQARLAFAEPIGHLEGLAAALALLAQELCDELARRRAGLRRLDIVLRRVDGQPIGIRIGTAAPTRDPAHLVRLVGERLAAVDPGFGIDEMVVAASRAEPLGEHQACVPLRAAQDGDGDPAALGPLVDRIGNRLGAGRVYRAAPVESRVPERSVRRIPALAPATGTSWPAALPRPSRLIDPPEPVTAVALVPDDPPASFTWRRVRYLVRAADGPGAGAGRMVACR